MATTTATISGFFEPILREVTNQSMREQPEEYPGVMRVIDHPKHTTTYQEWAGLGLAAEKAELGPIQFDDPIQGNRKTYTVSTKAKGFKASHESMEDDMYGIVAATAGSLGDSARESIELDAANLWNNCLSTDGSPILGFDGVSILNDTHTRLDGGASQDNLETGDIGLALIQSFRYHFRNLVNDRGFKNQGHVLSKLIIAPDATTEPLLDQILMTTTQPFTADNTSHELAGMRGQIQKVVYSYLSDTDRTIALSQKALSKPDGPFYSFRRRPSTTSWDDNETQASCYAISWRSTFGCPDWHGIAGSGG